MHSELMDKLDRKTAKIGIVGLGYVGLPLMLRYSEVGYKVIGFDVDQTKVEALRSGKSYIEHIPAASIRNATERGFEFNHGLFAGQRGGCAYSLRANAAQ